MCIEGCRLYAKFPHIQQCAGGLGIQCQKDIHPRIRAHLRYLNVDVDISNPEDGTDLEEVVKSEWRMWQEPFEYKNEIDLWEGVPMKKEYQY